MFVSFTPGIRQKLQKIEELQAQQAAFFAGQAVVEFDLQGTILNANEQFLALSGYTLRELVQQDHKRLLDPKQRTGPSSPRFWQALQQGQSQSDEYYFVRKDQRELWLHATYHPILDQNKRPYKVVAIASDITERLHNTTLSEGQIAAINRAQCVIHFETDGKILWANENFLTAFGYTNADLQGKDHGYFLDPTYRTSPEYRNFWNNLQRGQCATNVYRRIGQGGREVWLDASYDPILDRNGKTIRIVLFAIDVTQRQLQNLEVKGLMDAVNRSRASVTFDLQGTIIDANSNFLDILGYSLSELRGRHHQVLVDATLAESKEYQAIWQSVHQGKHHSACLKYRNKQGKDIWVSATYNPIFGNDGRPFKIVTFARNITQLVEHRHEQEQLIHTTLNRIVGAVSSVNERSAVAANASGTTSDTVQAVAAAAEQLSCSILSISDSMTSSRQAVAEVIEEANLADNSTQRLRLQASTMTSVVDLITDIAKRINLLALNASIESSRAGVAGRGFSVVANQVKSLAQQVSAATNTIGEEILQMQTVANEVVDGLSSIRQSIGSVEEAVVHTADAVKEQGAVTRDISANMQSAASSMARITTSLVDILHAVEQANQSAHEGKELYISTIADTSIM